MQHSVIPLHLSEENFRRFEPYIAKAIRQQPLQYGFIPSSISVNTAVARVRDAMSSYAKYHWPTSLLTVPDFTAFRERIEVVNDEGVVRFLAKSGKKPLLANSAPPLAIPSSGIVPIPDHIEIKEPTKALLESLCVCRAYGHVPRLVFHGVNHNEVAQAIEGYDLAMAQQPDGSFVVV